MTGVREAADTVRETLLLLSPRGKRRNKALAALNDVLLPAAERADTLADAARAAINELGVPGDGYPAPVANAYEILGAALAAAGAAASTPGYDLTDQEAEEVLSHIGDTDGVCTDGYDLIEMAWVILANVSEGDWTKQPQEWQDAVVKWREHYHASLADRAAASTPLGPDDSWIQAPPGPVGPDGAAASTEECGSFGCVLPKGHNRGRADVPSNHRRAASTGDTE